MVAPLGNQQPIQNPIGTPPVVRNQPATTPAATPTAAPAASSQPATMPNQASQNDTTARQIAGFSNSLKFPGIISPPGKTDPNSMVQRITSMLESMLDHPPKPSMLEPIGQKLRALTDQLTERIESERRNATSEPAAETSTVASEAPAAEAPAAEAPAAEAPEAPEAEGPSEGPDDAGGAEGAAETGTEGAGEASAAETEASAGPAEADGPETESEPTSGTQTEEGGQEFAPSEDTRTQGDPNALQHYQAILSERYADLFQQLIGQEAYQKLQEMLSQYHP